MKFKAMFLSFVMIASQNGQACINWLAPHPLGELNSNIDEASGIEVSTINPKILYHINDSGDGPYIYLTNRSGQNAGTVEINNFDPKDTEDLSIGSCPHKKANCLYVGDIGDNKQVRSSIKVVILEEDKVFNKKSVNPSHIITLKYPEGPQNAESMAIHPNGDLFIATKDEYSSSLYWLPKKQLLNKGAYLKKIAVMKFSKIKDLSSKRNLATSMDISPDGKKFIVLTYNDAVEFDLNLEFLTSGKAPRDITHFGRVIQLENLEKQEALAYTSEKSFVYSTETKEKGQSQASLMKLECAL